MYQISPKSAARVRVTFDVFLEHHNVLLYVLLVPLHDILAINLAIRGLIKAQCILNVASMNGGMAWIMVFSITSAP